MTPREKKAAWITAYIVSLILVVIVAPFFVVGPVWAMVPLIASIVLPVIIAIWLVICDQMEED